MFMPTRRSACHFYAQLPRFGQIAILVSLLFFTQNWCFAQPVPSSCDGGSNLIASWKSDAWQITYQHLLEQNSPAINGVDLPETVHDSILRAVFAVFNAISLPARDTVIEQLEIRPVLEHDLHRVQVLVDTSFGWTAKWLDTVALTGNSWIDFLINTYDLEVENVQIVPDWVSNYDAAITLRTAKYINADFLAGLVANSSGVIFAYGLKYGSDGDHVFFENKADFVEITFRHGWTDCPTGCVFHRDWLFRVFPDCSVEFVSSYGDLLGTMVAAKELPITESRVWPVPSSDFLLISAGKLNGKEITVKLTGQGGQVFWNQKQPITDGRFDGSISLDWLADGLYFLILETENQRVSHPVMKRS